MATPPTAPEPEPTGAAALDLGPDGNGESIARAIATGKRRAVRACFERELKQQPKLSGNVVVELDLVPPDRVGAVRVSDDLDRPAFTRCVSSAMQQLSFVALNEEVSVRVPYVLSAGAK